MEVEAAKNIIVTDEFSRFRSHHVSSARGAHLAQYLGESDLTVALLYLNAAFEAEDAADPSRENIYIEVALRFLNDHIEVAEPSPDRMGNILLAAELSRRLGHFDAAIGRLEALNFDPYDKKYSVLRKIAGQIMELAARLVSKPENIR